MADESKQIPLLNVPIDAAEAFDAEATARQLTELGYPADQVDLFVQLMSVPASKGNPMTHLAARLDYLKGREDLELKRVRTSAARQKALYDAGIFCDAREIAAVTNEMILAHIEIVSRLEQFHPKYSEQFGLPSSTLQACFAALGKEIVGLLEELAKKAEREYRRFIHDQKVLHELESRPRPTSKPLASRRDKLRPGGKLRTGPAANPTARSADQRKGRTADAG